MKFQAAGKVSGGATGHPPWPGEVAAAARRHGSSALATGLAIAIAALAGCAPPTDVVDLHDLPQATKNAMLQVQILPVGMPSPPGAGSIGPVSGFGCGSTSVAASADAVQQLQIKALRLHATAVANVLIGDGGFGTCFQGYSAVANGTAVAPGRLPSTY
jgi:hypothetical protein